MSKEKGTLIKLGNNVASSARFIYFRQKMIEALDKKNRIDAIRRLCLAEHKEMRKQFDSLTTLRRYYTYYRNICRELVPQELLKVCFDIFNLTRDEMILPTFSRHFLKRH